MLLCDDDDMEGGGLLGVNCVEVKQKTKIINNFLFCFCIKDMLAVKLALVFDLGILCICAYQT